MSVAFTAIIRVKEYSRLAGRRRAAQRPPIADVARWEDVAELRQMKREMKKAAQAKAKR